MSNYVSLMTREYSEGRICIATDRLSGYLTSHGFSSENLWRNILEWTGQKFNLEKINIAVVNSAKLLPLNYIDNFKPISYEEIDLQYISINDLSKFDLIYFIGLPELVSDDTAAAIENYVKNGGGILIEVPDRGGENINIIRDIDSVYCSSADRPIYDYSYWTVIGKTHYVYYPPAIVNFYSTILFNLVPTSWSILMTDTPATANALKTITIVGSTAASFSVGYSNAFKNGIVEVTN